MLNLKKITTTVSLVSLGALSIALFGTGCDDGKSGGNGGAGGKSSVGGQAGTSANGGHAGSGSGGAGGATGGHAGSGVGGGAGGHAGATAAGGAAGGAAGSTATGGAGGSTGGNGGNAAGGAAGGNGGSAAGGTAGSAGGAGGAQTVFMYNVTLTGAAEVLAPGKTASTGSGAATVTLNTVAMTVSVQGSFTGLSSAAIAAHIHGPAAPGATAPAIVVLTPQAAVAGALTGSGTLTAAQIADLKSGMDYINVHTTSYPDGEIRGQIQ